MIGELGHFALILAFLIAVIQGTVPLVGAWRRVPAWMAVGVSASRAQFLLLGISYLCLTYVFIVSDFSFSYVAQNSNTALPLVYKISAVWGAHEGSMLLWAMAAGTGFALWIAAGVVLGVRDRLRHRRGASLRRALGLGFTGMTLAHLGAGIFIAGVTWTTGAGVERDVRLAPGESTEVSGYAFRFDGTARRILVPNYRAVRGTVQVLRDGEPYAVLHPEKPHVSRAGRADDRGGGRARLHARPLRGAR